MPRTRILLSGLVAVGLTLAACGGDDDAASDDDTTTTTEDDTSTDDTLADDGTEDEIDVCGLLDLETISSITGETFTTTEQTDTDTCQYTNDEETALVQLSVRQLEDGETEESFIADGEEACDAGTVIDGVDFSYAAAGFACEISGQPSVAVTLDGGAALLIGHASDPSLTTEQIVGALNELGAYLLNS